MSEQCEECLNVKRLELEVQRVDLDATALHREVESMNTEHELSIQGITTRMDIMQTQFTELRADVKQDIQSIKDDIPAMFENAVNRLMARIAKWLLTGLGIILLVIIFAFSRPFLVSGLQELLERAQTTEVEH